ncbi:MAG TPA: isoprenylcysteine carboxylmethyltransferase family protein [Candidatus Udaeobacter sp.]|nr:isoprenylcysteine carboxylmethyltransferase family protein [Candidatus Udaeobacter sp.]
MQPLHTDGIGLAALILVFLCWIIFALLFVLRKKPPKAEEARRVSAAKWGIFLQGCGFALVGSVHRAYWWPFSRSTIGEIALATVAVALALASDLWCMRAIRVLGKQWTYEARVIKGHELITSGPYAVVRNPIYLGMFGLMVSTGLVFTTWWSLVIAVVVFLVGNKIRIRAEERLLRETFGSQFDDYARRVPAFFPLFL